MKYSIRKRKRVIRLSRLEDASDGKKCACGGTIKEHQATGFGTAPTQKCDNPGCSSRERRAGW